MPLPYIVGVELNDADAEPVGTLFDDTVNRRRLCGEGAFDLVGIIAALRAAGWDGPWGVEISVPSSPGLVHQRTAMASPISFAPRTRQSTDMITALWALIQSLRCASFSAEPLPSAR